MLPPLQRGRPFEERLGQRLYEMNAAMVGARADAREGLEGLRRLEAKLDRLAEAFDSAQRHRADPPSHSPSRTPQRAASNPASPGLDSGVRVLPKASHESAAAPPEAIAEDPAASSAHAEAEPDQPRQLEKDAHAADEQQRHAMDQRLVVLDRQLMLVAKAVGAPLLQRVSAGDDNEDRKRLKEKLKEALEIDRRGRLRLILSEREQWAEYLFGICQPDRRNGKRGNRWDELRDELLNQPYTCKCRISIRLGSAQTSIRWIDILLGAPEPSHRH